MTPMDFAGRVAIVTGAGRGMGRSHAMMLASRGARVVVNDLRGDAGDPASDVVREIEAAGGQAVASHCSVVDDAHGLIEDALAAFGRIDVLVCNAGIMSSERLDEASASDWQNVFDVHFKGTVETCRAAWPHLVSSGSGRIVVTSSSGMLGNEGLTSYGGAKAAIYGFGRSLAFEGEQFGINVNVIMPTAWTRMSTTIEDPAITGIIETHFQPFHVSALVTWLAHQDTRVNNEAFQVSGGRAGRIMMAALPTVRVSESTPEMWVQVQGELLADGRPTALRTTADLFGSELAAADPAILEVVSGDGGIGYNRASGR
jgi:NAD(P)-dependent dehydrogenase (short-subunit alcohol dehydrogenase family)